MVDKAEVKWNWISWIIGFLFGALFITILVWIAYTARTFAFVNCPSQTKPCFSADFFNNPGDALANGATLNDILFINNDQLNYVRQKRISACAPQSNQTVVITNPQFCEFTLNDEDFLGKSLGFNVPKYLIGNDQFSQVVLTDGNCQPQDPTITGRILPIWEKAPLQNN